MANNYIRSDKERQEREKSGEQTIHNIASIMKKYGQRSGKLATVPDASPFAFVTLKNITVVT